MIELISRLIFGRRPELFRLVCRLRKKRYREIDDVSQQLPSQVMLSWAHPETHSDFCIESMPGSGTTSVIEYVQRNNPRAKFARRMHQPASMKYCVKHNIPCVLLVVDPEKGAKSACRRFGGHVWARKKLGEELIRTADKLGIPKISMDDIDDLEKYLPITLKDKRFGHFVRASRYKEYVNNGN